MTQKDFFVKINKLSLNITCMSKKNDFLTVQHFVICVKRFCRSFEEGLSSCTFQWELRPNAWQVLKGQVSRDYSIIKIQDTPGIKNIICYTVRRRLENSAAGMECRRWKIGDSRKSRMFLMLQLMQTTLWLQLLQHHHLSAFLQFVQCHFVRAVNRATWVGTLCNNAQIV